MPISHVTVESQARLLFMQCHIDLVLVFRAVSPSPAHHFSKQKARQEAQDAEDQYTRLLATLRKAGLHAVGRRGEHQGQLILLVSCSGHQLRHLLQRERHSDVLHGLSTCASDVDPSAISPAERLRLVHSYVTATPLEGGLGIHPDNDVWSRVESIMALHDPEFNQRWIHAVTKTIDIGHTELDFIRSQFGEAVALYFAFLASYTHNLIFISVVGLLTYYFGHAYSILYSSLLFLWSVVFVEYWRIRERLYAVAWCSLGSVRVEKHRPKYIEGHPWWKRELKILFSVPVITLFASVLAVLLTAIFVFEAFVATLYTGPGHQYISFVPTILLAAIVPRFLAIYQTRAQNLTQWENHKHQSSFDTSLTMKSFALSSVVAYLGLALSAFIYIPFGETVMNTVQQSITTFTTPFPSATLSSGLHTTKKEGSQALFVSDIGTARAKLDRSRLQDQMFAYTVTNQATGFFFEVGLPFLTRAYASVRSGKRRPSLSGGSAKKKRVGFEDDKNGAARDEREFLERVRREVSLPQYTLFEDYNEMVDQFGYIALWSTIWPLAPFVCLFNNVFEFPSDAFKIVTHFRHPLPQRTDTIGPWLDCLSFLAWCSALTNSALVYLFRPQGTATTAPAAAAAVPAAGQVEIQRANMQHVLTHTLFIALASSHGFILLRALVRHVLERVMWYGSVEKKRLDDAAREVKEQYVQSIERRDGTTTGVGGDGGTHPIGSGVTPSTESTTAAPIALPSVAAVTEEGQKAEETPAGDEFWQFDEGLDEIRKGIKDS